MKANQYTKAVVAFLTGAATWLASIFSQGKSPTGSDILAAITMGVLSGTAVWAASNAPQSTEAAQLSAALAQLQAVAPAQAKRTTVTQPLPTQTTG